MILINLLLQAIKQASNDLMENSKLCDWLVGVVTNTKPLEITIDNSLQLPAEVLYLTKNTTDWTMEMTVDHKTTEVGGGGGYAEFAPHSHGYKGKKKYIVHNALKKGEQVFLLRAKGGQKFIVLDRVFNEIKGCND